MNVSDILSNKGNFATITTVTLLLPFVKIAVDSFNLKAVEKILYTPSKRLGIFLTQILLIDIVILFIFYSSMFFLGVELDVSIIETFIILMLPLSITMISICFFLMNILSVKFKFSFKDDTGNEWDIEKRISKNKVLVCQNNTYKFFEYNSLMEKELERKLVRKIELPYHAKIINKLKIFFILTGTIMVVTGFGAMLSEGYIKIIFFLIFMSSVGLILYAETIKNNKLLMDKYP